MCFQWNFRKMSRVPVANAYMSYFKKCRLLSAHTRFHITLSLSLSLSRFHSIHLTWYGQNREQKKTAWTEQHTEKETFQTICSLFNSSFSFNFYFNGLHFNSSYNVWFVNNCCFTIVSNPTHLDVPMGHSNFAILAFSTSTHTLHTHTQNAFACTTDSLLLFFYSRSTLDWNKT